MKDLKEYINEGFKLSKNHKSIYRFVPNNKDELLDAIKNIISEFDEQNDDVINLNVINTAKITDMSDLFNDRDVRYISKYFDISEWDVSNVTTMEYMFYGADYTGEHGDISNWDVSNVEDMSNMFRASEYNGDISNWDVSNVKDMFCMFYSSRFTGKNGDISKWDVSNVINMQQMFMSSEFRGDLSKWKPEKCVNMSYMFCGSHIMDNLEEWNVDFHKTSVLRMFKDIPFLKGIEASWYKESKKRKKKTT